MFLWRCLFAFYTFIHLFFRQFCSVLSPHWWKIPFILTNTERLILGLINDRVPKRSKLNIWTNKYIVNRIHLHSNLHTGSSVSSDWTIKPTRIGELQTVGTLHVVVLSSGKSVCNDKIEYLHGNQEQHWQHFNEKNLIYTHLMWRKIKRFDLMIIDAEIEQIAQAFHMMLALNVKKNRI